MPLALFGLLVSTVFGTLAIWLLAKPISGIGFSFVNSFWAVAITQSLSATIALLLGYLLAYHLGIGLILATIVKWFIQATILLIMARSTANTMPALKAYILATIVVAVDFVIVSPLISLVAT